MYIFALGGVKCHGPPSATTDRSTGGDAAASVTEEERPQAGTLLALGYFAPGATSPSASARTRPRRPTGRCGRTGAAPRGSRTDRWTRSVAIRPTGLRLAFAHRGQPAPSTPRPAAPAAASRPALLPWWEEVRSRRRSVATRLGSRGGRQRGPGWGRRSPRNS